MGAYVQPLIAEAYQQQGDTAGAIAAYEAALAAPSHRLNTIAILRQLADFYLSQGDYAAAIVQYDAIHDLAETEITRGEDDLFGRSGLNFRPAIRMPLMIAT
ncbi:MAG: tetratricopeptide repeat protein [Chloroflexota bacterium]